VQPNTLDYGDNFLREATPYTRKLW
jgi:hypothetical protein